MNGVVESLEATCKPILSRDLLSRARLQSALTPRTTPVLKFSQMSSALVNDAPSACYYSRSCQHKP